MPSAPKASRILVIRRRYLGDLVLLGSVFRNLRLNEPAAHIALLSERAFAPIGKLHLDVDQVKVIPKSIGEWLKFWSWVRKVGFTQVLDFDNTDKTAIITRLTGAAVRVTYDRETNPFRHRWIYTGSAKVSNHFYTSQHITETYLKLLEPVGVPVTSREIRLVPREQDLQVVKKYALGMGPKILLHPGSRSRFRIWPSERFAAVCDYLQDELNAQVFIVAGPGELTNAQEIQQKAQGHVVLIDERFPIGQFAALISTFDLFLCHDSGPMHIAAGVGVPVVALFGSQNSAIWKPVGEGHTILQTELPCSCLSDLPIPCVKSDSYRNYCVRKLTVDEVSAALHHKLAPQS